MTTDQLRQIGLSQRAVQGRAERGALIRVYRGVYAVGRLPTTPHDRAHGALLAAGKHAALAGLTALALWRNERDWPQQIELVSAKDIRIKGLTIRRSKSLHNKDFRRVQGLRVTSPARTALDVAASVGTSHGDCNGDCNGARGADADGDGVLTIETLTRIVNDLRHVNRLKVHELRDVTNRNPLHPGTKYLIAIIGEAQPQPTRSKLEDAFRRMLTRHKLPVPQTNVPVGGETVDWYYPEQDLIVELDGREVTHADDWRPAFENDRARVVKVMATTGTPTIRFTHDQTTRLHDETARQLREILDARLRGAPEP